MKICKPTKTCLAGFFFPCKFYLSVFFVFLEDGGAGYSPRFFFHCLFLFFVFLCWVLSRFVHVVVFLRKQSYDISFKCYSTVHIYL